MDLVSADILTDPATLAVLGFLCLLAGGAAAIGGLVLLARWSSWRARRRRERRDRDSGSGGRGGWG